MKDYKALVRYALANDCTLSVWDGEEWSTKKSKDYQAIIQDIEGVDEAQIRIRDHDGGAVAWALIIPGLDPDETIADYSVNEWMQAWEMA
jgi:hypothetical protein